MEYFEGLCVDALVRAESGERGTVEWKNAWLSYLFCARNELVNGLRYEESNLRTGARTIRVPESCESLKMEGGGSGTAADLHNAIQHARQVNDLRLKVPELVRVRIEKAGLADRAMFADALEELDRIAANSPRDLTSEYASDLQARMGRLQSLMAECSSVVTARKMPDGTTERIGWALTCAPGIEIVTTQGGRFEECRGDLLLEPGARLQVDDTAEARLRFRLESGESLSAVVGPVAVVGMRALQVRNEKADATLVLFYGPLSLDVPAQAAVTVRAGGEDRFPLCRVPSGAKASFTYDPGGEYLTVEVEQGKVVATTPANSVIGTAGNRLRFIAGKKID